MAVATKLGELEAMLGRFEIRQGADQSRESARSRARRPGRRWTERSATRPGWRCWRTSPAAAEVEARASYEILDRMGNTGNLASTAPYLGDIVYAQGGYDEAYELSEFTERITMQGDVDAEVRWRFLRAKTLARWGRHDEAEPSRDGRRATSSHRPTTWICTPTPSMPSRRCCGSRTGTPTPRQRSAKPSPCAGGKGTWSRRLGPSGCSRSSVPNARVRRGVRT